MLVKMGQHAVTCTGAAFSRSRVGSNGDALTATACVSDAFDPLSLSTSANATSPVVTRPSV